MKTDLNLKFGFKVTEPVHIPSAKEILSSYSARMNALVQAGKLQEADVLRPVIVLQTIEGEYIARQIGDVIPKGAMPVTVLTDEIYYRLISEGKFPIGDGRLTNTHAPTFVHDIAHLAGFWDEPAYMRLIRKYAIAKLNGSVPSLHSRSYHFNEGLTIINPNARRLVQKVLDLPTNMAAQVDGLSVAEVENFLKTLPDEQLRVRRQRLIKVLYNRKIVKVLGGAGREPYSGSGGNDVHNPVNAITDLLISDSVDIEEGKRASENILSRVIVAVDYLQKITLEDWYDTLLHESIAEKSPVAKLIKSGALDCHSASADSFGGARVSVYTELFKVQANPLACRDVFAASRPH